ncbi:hypothetical protein FA048_06975 [Pedobacter polaris]|uniref:Uncharacterized protein n=1 Tax=Pedobacter polaris TaxID=2571273 RepID=A0A4U1CR59_9SPHI|nr:hypothetical protein [Pedobacter polaris]TKC09946.1 hypothetical protein FA048_06975 [Pedobacter polaris]
MDTNNEFNHRETQGENRENQFRIEVADGNQAKFFSIRPLGNGRYEIIDDDGTIGTIQLDETDHARCESQGCELDLPLLHSIRDQIQFHQQLKSNTQEP